ncbi:MAG: MlaD family protein [Phycisphaerae bacterium]
MKETTRNFLVGIFVILAMGALSVLLVMFGETPTWLRTSDWELQIYGVREMRGVSEGTPVTLNGVEIGRVSGLDFRDRAKPERGIVINCMIKREFSIPSGAEAKVYGATLGMGTGLINIVLNDDMPSTTALPKDNAVLHGQMSSMLNELIPPDAIASFQRTVDEIGNFAAASAPVAQNLEKLLEERPILDVDDGDQDVMANISTAIERIDSFVANLNMVLGDTNVQEDVKGVVVDLKASSSDLRAMITELRKESLHLLENVNGAVDKTETNLDNSFKSLDKFLMEISTAAASIARIVNEAEAGKGTAGLILKDERLYESAVVALARLNESLANIATITGKIRDDGFITVALPGPVGPIPVKKYETEGGSKEDRAKQ